MTQIPLYRYPFDKEGSETLTLEESIAAMRELEEQLNGMLNPDWRWCDLRLKVIERHPTYVIYEIAHREKYAGQAVVMPYSADPPKIGPLSTINDRTLHNKIRSRGKPKGA
jgi:hypothetical protein